MTHYIYALIDPRDMLIYYVGQTDDPNRRYGEHLKGISQTSKARWLAELAALGYKPIMIILQTCEDNNVFYTENWWIILGRRQGWPLTNGTNPGAWRVKNDFAQLFSEQLRTIESEIKAQIAIAARKQERERHKQRAYLALCVLASISIVVFCICLTLLAWGDLGRAYYASSIAILLVGYGYSGLYAGYSHMKKEASCESAIRNVVALIAPLGFILLGLIGLVGIGYLMKG